MKSQKKRKTLALTIGLMMSCAIGFATITEANASEICAPREQIVECRKKTEAFDDLETEARKVRQQRDEAQGARNELRMLYFDTLADAQDWQLKAKAAQEAADAAPSRLVWFGAGAAVGVVTTVVVFVLVQ